MHPPSEFAELDALGSAFAQARGHSQPFRYWTLRQVLPAPMVEDLQQLPVPTIDAFDNQGKRATNNAQRMFGSAEAQRRYSVWRDVAWLFQHPFTVAAIERRCRTRLEGTFLRLEYCVDTGGFWLEPHTDIGAKRLTLLVYLSDCPGSEAWGTDLLYPDGALARRAVAVCNSGVMFVPGADTWHGFAKRPIDGVRRTLIVNYVGPEWQSRAELAYSDMSVCGHW